MRGREDGAGPSVVAFDPVIASRHSYLGEMQEIQEGSTARAGREDTLRGLPVGETVQLAVTYKRGTVGRGR